VRRGFCLFAVLAAAGPVLAQELEPQICVPVLDGVEVGEAPVDLGGGFVAQSFEAVAGGLPDPFVMFTECDSGFRLIAARIEFPDGRPAPEQLIDVMREALASGEPETGPDLVERFIDLGAPAQLRQSNAENCPCAVFYPEARGEKVPWEAPE